MHLLVDGLTCIPQEAWLHQGLRFHLPALERMARVLTEGRQNIESLVLDKGNYKALAWLEGHRIQGTTAYALPFLSHDYCDKLIVEARAFESAIGYTPNEDEEVEFQIPEFVLQHHCSQLATGLNVLFQRAMVPISTIVHGQPELNLVSAQLARYEPRGVRHGNWHFDDDSDCSVVVSLAPDLFNGGGTDLRTGPLKTVRVPKLPKGHALMFHGKTTLHRGCRVDAGVRDLLVFWSKYDGRAT
jgi:hypothetical protein